MTAPLLKIEHLEVRYGDLIGVADVSLEVPEGSVVALLGSNGGGKTTTLNAIAGLDPGAFGARSPFAASRSAASPPMRSCARAWRCRRRAGGCSCSRASRTICCSAPRRCATRRAPRRCSSASTRIFPKLAERRSQRAGTMSGGERQMLAVGRALMSDPEAADAGRAAPRARARRWWNRCTRPSAGCTAKGLTILLAEQSIELALEVSDFADRAAGRQERAVRHRVRPGQ